MRDLNYVAILYLQHLSKHHPSQHMSSSTPWYQIFKHRHHDIECLKYVNFIFILRFNLCLLTSLFLFRYVTRIFCQGKTLASWRRICTYSEFRVRCRIGKSLFALESEKPVSQVHGSGWGGLLTVNNTQCTTQEQQVQPRNSTNTQVQATNNNSTHVQEEKTKTQIKPRNINKTQVKSRNNNKNKYRLRSSDKHEKIYY